QLVRTRHGMTSDATRVVHAGLPAPAQGEPFLPGPTFAAPFHLTGDPSSSPFGYQRDGNPTWQRYEAALGALEGAEAVLFASGMAAVSAVVLALGPGDVLVAPADGYPGIRALGREHLAPRGVEVRLVPTDEAEVRAALGGATLVWLETPSNPGLDVAPIASLAARDDVSGVRHPGRPGDPAHATAAAQMTRFGSVVGFALPDADRAQAFLAHSELVTEATSFGGLHTTAERRARWGTDAVAEGFIRLSAGIEAKTDLLADVTRALDA